MFRYLLLAVIAAAAFAQTARTISGSVADESGAPLAGAKVYYNNSPNIVRDQTGHTKVSGPVVNGTTLTAKDGTFTVGGLPAGVYWLCAEGTQATHIRSCDWGFDATKLDLSKVFTATNAKLQVHDGVALTFQVNDERAQIRDYATEAGNVGAPGNFRIFVVDGARVKAAAPVSASGNTHLYSLIVPKSRAVRLLLDTKLIVLNQSQSAAYPGKLDDTISVSGQPVTYSLTVQ